MPTGLPDWWRKYYFVGQEEGVWGIMPWAAKAGYYKGIFMEPQIIPDSYYVTTLFTVPSGKTFYLTAVITGANYEPAYFWLGILSEGGIVYMNTVVHNQMIATFPVPVPIPGGTTLELRTFGFDSTGGIAFVIVQGFLI